MNDKEAEFESNYVHKFYEFKASVFSESRKKPWGFTNIFFNKYCNENSVILDSGCGNGREFLSKNVIGLDYSLNLLLDAKKKPSIGLIRGNINYLPFKRKSFDIIMSIAVIHHLCTHERRLKCLLEMRRVLKDDGVVLVYAWHINASVKKKFNSMKTGDNDFLVSWKGENDLLRYYYLFDEKKLNMLCESAGFEIIESGIEQESVYAVLKKNVNFIIN